MILKSCSVESLSRISSLIFNTGIDINDGFFFSTFKNWSIINKGGFGIVLKAEDNLRDTKIAIKIIPFLIEKNNPTDIMSLHIHRRLREVRCLSNLNNNNIIKYEQSWIETGDILENIIKESNNLEEFIYNTKDNIMSSIFSSSIDLSINHDSEYQIINIFIEMELMELSLKNYLRQIEIKDREINLIIREIISGVQYLHDKGIIHRDLKPENILINLDKNHKIIDLKIADFGLIIDRDNEDISTLDGTPLYMPSNDNKITEKYDIFSIGIIMFELVNDFTTEMERILTIKTLRENEHLDNPNKYYQNIYAMIDPNPEKRPNLDEIIV